MEDKITIVLNHKKIALDNLTSYMLKEQFKNIFDDNFINLDVLDSSTKIILLDKIFSFSSNSVVIMFDDEFINHIPNGREKHNDLFNRVRLIDSMIKFREKHNDKVDEYKLKKLPEIIISINEYENYMKRFNNNIKKK